MVRKVITTVFVVILLLGALIPILSSTEVNAEGPAKIQTLVSSKGTFLRADPFVEERPDGGSNVESPTILDLEENGIKGYMWIKITFQGQICYDLSQEPQQFYDITNLPEVGEAGLLGVFSNSNAINPIYELNRVRYAIDAGVDYITGLTYFEELPTDIPQDFAIEQNMEIMVPMGAQYLFICANDVYYPDNLGAIQVTIEKDSDGDGLFDSWEYYGIDSNNDGIVDLDLPLLGADWRHKDIFVEADFMKNHAPNVDAINDVKAAFQKARIPNPDNIDGITLHVLIDEEVPEMEFIGFSEFYAQKNQRFGTADERGNLNLLQAKKMVYRYCIFANKLSFNAKCPGIAEGKLCDDFILAYGAFADGGGSREYQAAVFMHELGHTLGLGHGGPFSSVNYKPNYPSIMNYAYQYADMLPSRPLDYSYGRCRELNESSLEEGEGIGQAIGLLWTGPNNTIYKDGDGILVDWNGNARIDSNPVAVNVNNRSGSPSPPGETIRDSNDWYNLVYKFRGTPLSAASATPDDYHIELTTDQIEQMKNDAANVSYSNATAPEGSGGSLSTEVVLAIGAGIAASIIMAVVILRKRRHD